MCGIAGYIAKEPLTDSSARLEQMISCIRHRGPDASGYHVVDNGLSCGLAHARLSVIDLDQRSHQPMTDETGMIWIVYNGEIYNYRKLRRNLEKKGVQFHTESDTEVLLKGLREEGPDFVKKCIGMFSFAAVDRRNGSVMLCRDRLGIKPLYYAVQNNLLIFASELSAVISCMGKKPELNSEALSYYLSLQYVPAPFSIYEGIFKLASGHMLIKKADSLNLFQYWNISDTHFDQTPDRDYFTELIEDAVKIRMVSDVPLGAFLSGGVDSSLVSACMSHVCQSQIKTFTIGFSEEQWNEAPYAEKIAEYLNTEQHTTIYSENDIINNVKKAACSFGEPFGDSSALCTFLVSEAARKKVTVILSGDGGDELFSGYHRYRLFKKLRLQFFLPLFLRKGLFQILNSFSDFKLRTIAGYLTAENHQQLYTQIVSIIKPHVLHDILKNPSDIFSHHLLSADRFFADFSLNHCGSVSDLYGYLPGDILPKVDICSMYYALECRVPLLDHRVAEAAYYLLKKNDMPPEKQILKDILKQYIPENLFVRPKKGFSVPMGRWLKGPLYELLNDYLSEKSLDSTFFDVKEIHKLIKEHMSGKTDHSHRLWIILMFEMWRKTI